MPSHLRYVSTTDVGGNLSLLWNGTNSDYNASENNTHFGDGYLYYDYYEMMDVSNPVAANVIHRIILPTICTVGITGIIITIIVLSQKVMSTSTNCYLIALAVTDLLFLILLASTLADNQFVPHSKEYYLYVIYVTYASIFMHIFLLTSIWLTVMLAVERFIAICRPFLANKICTIGKARAVILAIYTAATVCRLPNFWENRVVTVYDTLTNSSLVYAEVTAFSLDAHYVALYPWLVDGLIASVIPFILLLALNVRLVWEVRRSSRYLQRSLSVSSGQNGGATSLVHREEMQVTIMLISVIVVFFICQAPYVIYSALMSIRQFSAPSGGIMLFRYITMLLLTLKSAVNFILYCWFSEKFWFTLKRLCCLKHRVKLTKRHINPSVTGSSYSYIRRLSSVISTTKDTTI